MASVKRTRVPSELGGLSRDELAGLVKCLETERDAALDRDAKKPRPSPADTEPSAKEVSAVLKRLADKSWRAIKKTKHNQQRKPYTEVTEGVPTKALALSLMGRSKAQMQSDTARMTRWLFDVGEGASAADWLGMDQVIHPVAFDGKVRQQRACAELPAARPHAKAWHATRALIAGQVWCMAGTRPSVYAHAAIESLEVKWEPSSSLMTLKFRTFYCDGFRC